MICTVLHWEPIPWHNIVWFSERPRKLFFSFENEGDKKMFNEAESDYNEKRKKKKNGPSPKTKDTE